MARTPPPHTVPKTRQISEKIREEVPWRENFLVIRGNEGYFPRITRKFSLQGTSSSLPKKICQIFGTVQEVCLHSAILPPGSLIQRPTANNACGPSYLRTSPIFFHYGKQYKEYPPLCIALIIGIYCK
jgi:hypothetical protein